MRHKLCLENKWARSVTYSIVPDYKPHFAIEHLDILLDRSSRHYGDILLHAFLSQSHMLHCIRTTHPILTIMQLKIIFQNISKPRLNPCSYGKVKEIYLYIHIFSAHLSHCISSQVSNHPLWSKFENVFP